MFLIQFRVDKNNGWLDKTEKSTILEAKKYIENTEEPTKYRIVSVEAVCETKIVWNDKQEIDSVNIEQKPEGPERKPKVKRVSPQEQKPYKEMAKELKEKVEDNQSACRVEECKHYNDGECEVFSDIYDPMTDEDGNCTCFEKAERESPISDEDKKNKIIEHLIRISNELEKDIENLTLQEFNLDEKSPTYGVIYEYFESWPDAKAKAKEAK